MAWGKGAGEGGGGGPSRWTGPNKNANYGEVGSVALINRLITGIVPNSLVQSPFGRHRGRPGEEQHQLPVGGQLRNGAGRQVGSQPE